MNFESDERNLPQKISEDIISFILNEHLQPGDKLPNEAHLAKELNIGRSSLREAMKLLASRNIVTIRQGSGTYVASSPGVVDDPLGFTFVFYWSQLSQLCLQHMRMIMILRKLFLCAMKLKNF